MEISNLPAPVEMRCDSDRRSKYLSTVKRLSDNKCIGIGKYL